MADTISSLLQLLLMDTGSHNSDWGSQTNTNLGKLETAISGITNLTVTGGSITLTDDQSRAGILFVNGTLTGDQTIIVPARVKIWTVVNITSGGHNVLVQTLGNTATLAPAGSWQFWCDATFINPIAPAATPDTGKISMWGTPTAPTNHLLCFGQAVSRTTYAALFAVLGTTYGAGDGTTTFNLPDFRGVVPCGLDSMGGTAKGVISTTTITLGNIFGEQVHVLTSGEMPSHNHGVTDPGHTHGITDPGHNHTFQESPFAQGPTAIENIPFAGGATIVTTSTNTTGITVNSATTGISIGNTGGGGYHNNLQPSIFINFIIRI